MTLDQDELLLQSKLQSGLHPAEINLWPAVAEGLPAADRRRTKHRRLTLLAACLAAPALIAAGVYIGKITFISNPEPPPNPGPVAADYQLKYTIHTYTGDDLQADFVQTLLDWHTAHADEMEAGKSFFDDGQYGYDETVILQGTWSELTEQTGLPLLQSTLTPADTETSPDDMAKLVTTPLDWRYEVYDEDGLPNELRFRQYVEQNGYTVGWSATAAMVPRSTAAAERDVDRQITLYNHLSSLAAKGADWKYETYRMPTGDDAIIPYCGKARHRLEAYFIHDGIYYEVELTSERSKPEAEALQDLKAALDAFTAESTNP